MDEGDTLTEEGAAAGDNAGEYWDITTNNGNNS
jgi:hypothetical protein